MTAYITYRMSYYNTCYHGYISLAAIARRYRRNAVYGDNIVVLYILWPAHVPYHQNYIQISLYGQVASNDRKYLFFLFLYILYICLRVFYCQPF